MPSSTAVPSIGQTPPPAADLRCDAAFSRYVQRIRRRYGAWLDALPPGVPGRAAMAHTFERLRQGGHDTGTALRILRQLVLERLVVIDAQASDPAPLTWVTGAMTELAEFALDAAMAQSANDLDALHGAPQVAVDPGEPQRRACMWVIGMGKLGARELNVSSDIDLIYIYDEQGHTCGRPDGRGVISNHEYFAQQVKAVYALIGEVTEHGFVFRVDLALRPNGNSGPPAVSLGALEEYFQVQGREWERFAWLKSRVVAPRASLGDGSTDALRQLVLPFVFRRYLDYNVFESLRVLHRQIREQAARRAAGHPERANDVKLSRGGIREIEFTVQLLQVVRGGQFPELRTRPTVGALARVSKAGLMPAATAEQLAQAYDFLRRVEHRIQYLDDQQTHVLPTQDADLNWIAATLGFAYAGAFLAELDRHREFVAQEFDKLLGGHADCVGCFKLGQGGAPQDLAELLQRDGAHWPQALRDRLSSWQGHPRVLALREESRARLLRLLQRTAAWLADGRVGQEAVLRLIDWMEPLLRRESYLALLIERPSVHERLLRLLGAARWPARYLLQHPGVIDELANGQMLQQRLEPQVFVQELTARLDALRRTGEDDEEACLNLLRRAHHAEVFRTLARDVEGQLSVEQVADDLSALAEAVLRLTAQWCWQRLKLKHREDPQLGIIAYGKLGGKELGYGSDLDVVFVYEDDDERAPEVYAAFARKLINWLTVKTSEGDLFEIDTALRPNGNSGLLVTRFAAYADYQQQRGSNTAWTWEHQAMTRARFVLGSASLQQRFDQVRQQVIMAERDAAALREEIVAMREKVRAAHPVRRADVFDIKHSAGGMVDVEFVVQYLVLAHACSHPQLVENVGNIALLERAEQAGLLPAGQGQAAASAYRELRRVQHRARLDEEPTQLPVSDLVAQREAVLRLWQQVLG
jgi:[glutamine synthetase] adenylyltransferase / [glutamine synthetase]-adenylyl-L-tyrosine phosphorylase